MTLEVSPDTFLSAIAALARRSTGSTQPRVGASVYIVGDTDASADCLVCEMHRNLKAVGHSRSGICYPKGQAADVRDQGQYHPPFRSIPS